MGMPIIAHAHSSERQPCKCHRNTANQVLALPDVNISDMMEHSKLTPHFLANFLLALLFQENVNFTHLIMSDPPYYSQCRMECGPKSRPTLHTHKS